MWGLFLDAHFLPLIFLTMFILIQNCPTVTSQQFLVSDIVAFDVNFKIHLTKKLWNFNCWMHCKSSGRIDIWNNTESLITKKWSISSSILNVSHHVFFSIKVLLSFIKVLVILHILMLLYRYFKKFTSYFLITTTKIPM